MLITAPPAAHSLAFGAVADQLVDVVRFLNGKGWTPATSSNFSARIPGFELLAISRSGVDKAAFTAADVMIVDRQGRHVWPEGARSSAETLIHTAIYDLFEPGAVLHTHSVMATAFSVLRSQSEMAAFSGLELLKGLSGVTTHDTSIEVPIFPNDQDMERFSAMLRRELAGRSRHGFLIAGHGLYTWGETLGDAQRHVEVFEFLFELALRMEGFNGTAHHS
ncbi:MAG: methylthioribulose-phosphate dehydratase [Chloroflexota bacterium]|jgi:methylthioribulose-1-phosphate dehydratase|nr:methylthioribulose-phosphate dehydratase [Chloroflexota bacterium]